MKGCGVNLTRDLVKKSDPFVLMLKMNVILRALQGSDIWGGKGHTDSFVMCV